MQRNLPKISIITPSYNQAKFIDRTIQSVLSQGYENLEYIVVDAGSTDGTIGILKKYKSRIKWISEKDEGQSDAINKGIKMSSGDILGYLNADDLLEKGSLFKIAGFFANFKEYDWVTGKCFIIDARSNKIRPCITFYKNIYLKFLRSPKSLVITNYISQPATFWKKKITQKTGMFNARLSYSMDYEYWLRIWKDHKLGFIDHYLASFRIHKSSKTVSGLSKQQAENYKIISGFSDSKTLIRMHKIHDKIISLFYNSKKTNEK